MIRELNANDFVYMLHATQWTLALSLIAVAGGGSVGILFMLLRMSRIRAVRWLSVGYVQFFQSTPLLMQLFLVFFGGSLFKIQLSPWTAAMAAFTLHASAYLADIWHGCVAAIPRGQWEGARSLALPPRVTFRFVILPQAARIAVPPTIGFLVQMIKSTSLASIIGFTELVRAGQFINNSTLRPLFVYGFVACVYFAICWPLSLWSQALEARLGKGDARGRR
jgi:polar amino acid transport system permease protein